jgi:DNA-binding transcriptional LysR family regulator
MELRHLRYFLQVGRELSFTKAAQSLRVAQPALSRQIQDLETEIGTQLIDRSGKKVRLTEAGLAFLKDAESILAQTQKAVASARHASQQYAGKLNLGYVWGLFHSLAPACIARFRDEHAGVAVNLLDLSATEQATAIAQGKLDGGFIGLSDEADSLGLMKCQVGMSSFIAALPNNHLQARTRRVALETLSSDFFLVISEQSFPGAARVVREACAEAGFPPKVLQHAARGHTILSLVASGCGVALLPESFRSLPHPGVVLRPLVRSPRVPLYFAWNKRNLSLLLEGFIKSCSNP